MRSSHEHIDCSLLEPWTARRELGRRRDQCRLDTAGRSQKTESRASTAFFSSLLETAEGVAENDPALAQRLYKVLSTPFAVASLNLRRQLTVISIAERTGVESLCADALAPIEPYPPWDPGLLAFRVRCYGTTHPMAEPAKRDMDEFRREAPPKLGLGTPAPS